MRVQEDQSAQNKTAWSYRAYEHWVRYTGQPNEAAARMKYDPASCVKELPLLGDVSGKKIINLLGSNGRKAVPLALLGAEVTVADISPEGARYALELAEAAGVHIDYLIADVMDLPISDLANSFDLVYMEGGVFHYFADLSILAHIVHAILSPGGRMVASDFHPIRKCLSLGLDYFDDQLHEADVAHQQFYPEGEQADFPKCQLRYWTLGEIVTAFAHAGLTIEQLVELPDPHHPSTPGQFVLTAVKLS